MSKSVEDYLETILIIGDHVHAVNIADALKVSKAAVTKALRLLQGKGYVEVQSHHVVLTDIGRDYAQRIYAKHKLIFEFLLMLGVTEEIAEQDACKIEHEISDMTVEKIQDFMDNYN